MNYRVFISLFAIITVGLTRETLGMVVGEVNSHNDSPTIYNSDLTSLVDSVTKEQLLEHLNQLQIIATNSGGTRAVGTIGFDRTIDYIYDYLTTHTNLEVKYEYFTLTNYRIDGIPTFISNINGKKTANTYQTHFTDMIYSGRANWITPRPVSNIPNDGCSDDDWKNAYPSFVAGTNVALVKRGVCTFEDKSVLAKKYGAVGLLIYNDGVGSERFGLMNGSVSEETDFPALFLSYQVGSTLAKEAQTGSSVSVSINMNTRNLRNAAIANIIADTPTGDKRQTIVIGSHSDGVKAGPGINDNGSGTAANLVLATNIARLLQTPSYKQYPYRIRFGWWAAEELGLKGSIYHVNQAKKSVIVGERIQDYLLNLNFDMLGSKNFMFGVYDGKTANPLTTPSKAIPGSKKLTELFTQFFTQQNFPSDGTKFDGRSDYGPFLAAGLVAGGLFSGAEARKTREQFDRYNRLLGQGMGGTSNAAYDACYHKKCDT
ncbi:unnamed protein product, partial [Didymodactylos carnosus]